MTTIAVRGDWHNAWVTAACLSELGHRVTLVSTAESLDVQEPGLNDMIARGKRAGTFRRCAPNDDWSAEIGWIALDTPVDDDDNVDIAPVLEAVDQVADRCKDIVVSSQIPLGFCDEIVTSTSRAVAYVPENMRLGAGIETFLRPDRLVIGASTPEYGHTISNLLFGIPAPPILTTLRTAEMAKHATNFMLALQISAANELAGIGQHHGVDMNVVAQALKADSRIGPKAYVRPGMPFAGGTLPRDLRILQTLGENAKRPTLIADAILSVNQGVYSEIWRQVHQHVPDVAMALLLGYSYKADITTLRRSPAIDLARVADPNLSLWGYDPDAQDTEALDPYLVPRRNLDPPHGDAIVVLTARSAFRSIDWRKLAAYKLVIDTCDGVDKAAVLAAGIPYKKLWGPVERP